MKLIDLRYAGNCAICASQLERNTRAWWDRAARTVTCTQCLPVPADKFVAGRSAKEMAERRSTQESDEWERAGLLKKAVIVWQDKPSKARSWAQGAKGEQIVGARLDQLETEGLIVAVHDVRIPGSRANVDHIAVAPSGVHIIDAKNYHNAQIEVVDRGGMFRTDVQLRVGGRNRTSLVEKLAKQILTVDNAMRDVALPTPVTPVLCFVDALWGIFKKEYKINSVHIVPPPRLERLLRRPGPLSHDDITHVGNVLRSRLRPN